jgi:ParB family transcriptional regulator, chromosome partitioning protein
VTPEKPRRLGRGLEALLASAGASAPSNLQTEEKGLQRVPISQIRPNPYQPRKEFRPDELADLQASLKHSGLLQPITLRSTAGGYELVAGERRLRAATQLGWEDIPAIVRNVDDRALLSLALVENLQRADLNPIEEAEGYQRLINEFQLTQQQVADAIGRDRSTIANMLRLLSLPVVVRKMVQDGQLSLGHARALLALPNERAIVDLARETVALQLTVREIERRARDSSAPRTRRPRPASPNTAKSPELTRITDTLRRRLQTDVQLIVGADDRGEIRINFYSADDLERLLELLVGRMREEM